MIYFYRIRENLDLYKRTYHPMQAFFFFLCLGMKPFLKLLHATHLMERAVDVGTMLSVLPVVSVSMHLHV